MPTTKLFEGVIHHINFGLNTLYRLLIKDVPVGALSGGRSERLLVIAGVFVLTHRNFSINVANNSIDGVQKIQFVLYEYGAELDCSVSGRLIIVIPTGVWYLKFLTLAFIVECPQCWSEWPIPE